MIINMLYCHMGLLTETLYTLYIRQYTYHKKYCKLYSQVYSYLSAHKIINQQKSKHMSLFHFLQDTIYGTPCNGKMSETTYNNHQSSTFRSFCCLLQNSAYFVKIFSDYQSCSNSSIFLVVIIVTPMMKLFSIIHTYQLITAFQF